VPVVFLIAIVAVLVGVFFAATGRGGELAIEHADHAPLDLGPVSAADIALLRPPTTAWGYNMQVTDEALDHIARAMRDRDVTIARLRQQLVNRDLMEPVARPAGAPLTQVDARRPLEVPSDPTAPQPLAASREPGSPQPLAASREPGSPQPLAASRESGSPQPLTVTTDTDAPQSQAVPSDSEDTQTLSFLKPPGILVASRSQDATLPRRAAQPPEVTQPSEVTQHDEVTQPHEAMEPPEATQPTVAMRPPQATQPTEINQPSDVTRGPQGSYDTHDWWAEQGAAHQDSGRPAEAQPATEPRPATPDDAPSAAEEQGW
jgi:hypothetical protein